MSTEVKPYEQSSSVSIFSNENAFNYAQRMAKFLSKSELVPPNFRGDDKGLANCMIALEFSNRMQVSPLLVMQNINVIEGRPTFSAKFMGALLESNGYELEYEQENLGKKKIEVETWVGPKGQRELKVVSKEIDDARCRIKAMYMGRTLYGEWVSMEMAHKEGWFSKPGSKWKTMPQIMLNYRAITFFSNQHAPSLVMGMMSREEAEEALPRFPDVETSFEELESDVKTPTPEPNPNDAAAEAELI
jgi:hypothetical protein